VSDAQAGHEKTMTSLLPALAGANLIYGMGMLELGVTFSWAQLVIDNEIANMVKRVVQGVKITDDLLGVEVIKKVGAGKDFLAQKHTRQFMASEQSKVKLIDRRMRGAWTKRGGKDLAEAAGEEARHILETHKPAPLPKNVLSKLRSIVEEQEALEKEEAAKAAESD
jgi:trimethylamine--corrinoid protein Co-methyltransferase